MELKLSRKNIIFFGLIFLSVIISAYFLNASGLIIKEMLNLGDLSNIIDKLKSSEFLFFVFSFPLTIALIVIHCKTEENKTNSFIAGLGGILTGLIISILLFPNLWGYLLTGLFYFIGITLTIELVHVKKLELKKYISVRLLGTGIHKTGTIIALGLFLTVSLTIYENQGFYLDQIDKQLLEVAGGEQTTGQLTGMFVDAIIETQIKTAEQITELEQFQALETSIDPNAVLFYQAVLMQKNYLNSAEYRQQITAEIKKKQDLGDDELKSVLDSVKQQMPLFRIITGFLWLIEGFAFFSIFLLLSNTIFYILTLVYGLIAEQIYNTAVKK